MRRTLAALCLIVASSWALADGKPWPIERGPSRGPAAYTYDPAALKGLPAEFLDDAPACIVYSGTVQRLADDGTIETTVQEVIRLNGRKGIDQLGEYRTITFNAEYDKVTLHEARVHKVKGGVEPAGPHNVQVRDVNTDHQVYDASKQVVISFPGLETGDAIEVRWTTRGRPPEYQGQMFARYTLGSDKYPVARDEFTVRIPRAKDLTFASVNGDVKPDVTTEGDERVYRWRANDRPVPPKGERLPPTDELNLQVAVSTFKTWDEVYAWERKLTADRCHCTPDVKQIVEDVTRGLTTEVDKARALTQWVRKTVRYVSAGETHEYTPHPPSQVIRHRYGDCKDTAHLLAVMLREAGIKAGLATLGVRGDGQVIGAVPSPWGTHAIAVATIDGKDHWLDTTANLIGWDVLPRDDRDRECYVVDDKGLRRVRTPKATPADSLTEQTVTLKVATDGSARGERVVKSHGLAAWGKRDDYVDTPAGERRRTVASDLHDAFTKVKLLGLSFESLDDYEKPVAVKAEFTLPEAFAGETRTATLTDASLWSLLLGVTVNEERKAALDLGAPFESRCNFTVALPAAFRFDKVPQAQVVNSAWGTYRLTVKPVKPTPRRLEFLSVLELSNPRVAPADFPAFEEFIESVQAAYRATVSLAVTTDPGDVPLLEEALALTPKDTVTACALAEICLAQKKPDDAMKVLKAARALVPGERKLWELSLKAAGGDEEAEPIYREAVKRFPEDPTFALDLADLLIDANKHDEARTLLAPLLQHPSDATKGDAHLILARCALEQEEARKALRHLKEAEKLHAVGFDAPAWELKGHVHEKLGEPDAALAAFRKAIEKEESSVALEALVRLTAKSSKTESLRYLRRYIDLVEDDAEGLARAADLSVQLGRHDDALEFASRARTDGKRLHDLALRPLGLAHAHRGEFAKAIPHLEKAPPDAQVFTTLLNAYVALGRLTDAEAKLKSLDAVDEPTADMKRTVEAVRKLADRRGELKKIAPDSPVASLDRVICAERFLADGKTEAAESLVESALADGARCGPAFGLRAVLALDRGRLAKSLRDADKAIELSPQDWRGHAARGRVRLERESPEAFADLEKAAALNGRKDAATLHALAAAHAKAGRTQKAIETQQEAVKLKPNDPELAEQLRELSGK